MPFASNECVPIASFKICGYRTISVTSCEILACQDSGSKMNKKKLKDSSSPLDPTNFFFPYEQGTEAEKHSP
jgi:hypothetical protein